MFYSCLVHVSLLFGFLPKIVHSFLDIQVICAFVSARAIVILSQTYIPLYLIETLGMDRVSEYIVCMYVCGARHLFISWWTHSLIFLQASIAKGPLILFISSFFTTLIMKQLNKVLGDEVSDCTESVNIQRKYTIMA